MLTIWSGAEGEKMENENVNIDETTEEVVEGTEEETTFTQAEVDSQISKAVETALQKREKKYAKELKDHVAKAVTEAQKLAQMSEDERFSEELRVREEAIAQREAEAERKEFLADVRSELTRKGLPITMAEMVVNSSTRETVDELIETIKADWDGALKETLKVSARQKDPQVPETTPNTNATNNLAEYAAKVRKVGN